IGDEPVEDRSFYVYQIHARDDGRVVYVGKGGGNRDRHWNKRNDGIRSLIRAGQTRKPVRVAANLTEAEAFAEEMRLIAIHGRKDLGFGSLENLTDGGAGTLNP